MIKFVLCSMPRSGTHAVRHAITARPDAYCRGEELAFTRTERINQGTANDPANLPAYLWRNLSDADPHFDAHADGVKALGWVHHICWQHQPTHRFVGVWQQLLDDREIDIVHLCRENSLRQYVSWRVAQASGFWSLPAGSDRPAWYDLLKVNVDPAKAVRMIEYCERRHAATAMFAKTHNYFSMTYEAMGDQFEALQQFLDLPSPVPWSTSLAKQSQRTLADTVANWDQLASAIRKTRHRWMLDDA